MKIRPFFAKGMFAAALALVVSAPALAYFSPLVFLPPQPVAGQPVAVRVGFGICDLLLVLSPQDRELVIEGPVIRVTVRGVEALDVDFCIYPDGYADFNIGPLSAGSYTVEIYRALLSDPTQIALVQTGTLVVGPGQVQPVPSTNPLGLALLCLGVLIGTVNLRLSRGPRPN